MKLVTWRNAVAAGCIYEIVALFSPLPTITQMSVRLRTHRAGRFVFWFLLGGAIEHFRPDD